MAALTEFDGGDLAQSLIDIDSTTPREGRVVKWLAAWLRGRGYNVEEQPVEDDRMNLIVTVGVEAAKVALSTHLDCVPPFFPSRLEGNLLYGRGACDAKGIAAAQLVHHSAFLVGEIVHSVVAAFHIHIGHCCS